ncbi:MAG: sensor histidine kinase [Candidatus Zixiibacteriota bacterium]
MKEKSNPDSPSRASRISRHALVIFVGLALLVVAQLAWWIIFQFGMIDTRYSEYISYADSRRQEILALLAPDFEAAGNLLMVDFWDLAGARARDSLRLALKANRFVASFNVIDLERDTIFSFGRPAVDAGARIRRGDLIVSLTLDYTAARDMAGAAAPRLMFAPPPRDSPFFLSLSQENLLPDSQENARFVDERASARTMLISEGAFFVALTLIGLGLIYRALLRSEEARRGQRNFLMAVTHELRTPLASVRLALQGIGRGKLSEENSRRALSMIDSDLMRLDRLIDALLRAGKSPRAESARERVELGRFITDYFAHRHEEFAGRNVTLTLDRVDRNHFVTMPTEDLRRALDIVVDNALKFSEPEPQISVALESVSNSIRLSVTDNGIGIPPDEAPRVFDRFYRVGNEMTRRTSGVGLGLFLARRMMRASDAEIEIQSRGVGQGTTVTFTFTASQEPTTKNPGD